MNNEFLAGIFDELTPIYPDTDVTTGVSEYTVCGANGSYAGISIVISGLTPGIPLCIDVKGEHTGFKLFNMLPVPVEVNTGAKLRSEYLKNDVNQNVIRRAPFMVYEALEPIYNIVMPTLTTMAISFKAIIEYCRENRTQSFEITLTHGEQSKTLKLNIELYKAVVPPVSRNTHQFINWFSFDAIAGYHHVEKWSPEFDALLAKYFKAAVFSRQNMLAIPLGEVFDGLTLNKPLLKKIVDIANSQGMSLFQGGAVATRALSLADDDDFYNSLDHSSIQNTDEVAEKFKEKAFDYFDNGTKAKVFLTNDMLPSEKGEAAVRTIAAQLYEFLKENDLIDSWVQCALDEPNDALCDTYCTLAKIIHEEMPGVSILEPVLPTKKIIGAVDIWCPSIDIYENNRDFFDDRVEKGDRLFVYTCLTPGGNYLNRLLDMERLRIVYLAWAAAKYKNVEGFLHWGANQFAGLDPFKRSAAMFSEQLLEFHPKRAMFLPAGDCAIFFPGFNEPLISVRSEAHRIGLEDLCLLEQLAKKDEALADSLVAKLFRGYADYEKSVLKYREVKREILKALS